MSKPFCVICSEVYKETDQVCVISCGHVFHYLCLNDLVRSFHWCPECHADDLNYRKIFMAFKGIQETDMPALLPKEDDKKMDIKTKSKLDGHSKKIGEMKAQLDAARAAIRRLESNLAQREVDYVDLSIQYSNADDDLKRANEAVEYLTIQNNNYKLNEERTIKEREIFMREKELIMQSKNMLPKTCIETKIQTETQNDIKPVDENCKSQTETQNDIKPVDENCKSQTEQKKLETNVSKEEKFSYSRVFVPSIAVAKAASNYDKSDKDMKNDISFQKNPCIDDTQKENTTKWFYNSKKGKPNKATNHMEEEKSKQKLNVENGNNAEKTPKYERPSLKVKPADEFYEHGVVIKGLRGKELDAPLIRIAKKIAKYLGIQLPSAEIQKCFHLSKNSTFVIIFKTKELQVKMLSNKEMLQQNLRTSHIYLYEFHALYHYAQILKTVGFQYISYYGNTVHAQLSSSHEKIKIYFPYQVDDLMVCLREKNK